MPPRDRTGSSRRGGTDVEDSAEHSERARARGRDDRGAGARRVDAGATDAAAATPSFTAVGSARQVYVTGLAPSTQMTLVNSAGTVVETRTASSLGGVLFRDVTPASGYTVRAGRPTARSRGAITVHSESAAPWDPGDLRPVDPESGYGYLTTRDGTKLAVHRAPADEPDEPRHPDARAAAEPPDESPVRAALPDAHRVLGLRLRQPGRARRAASRCSRTSWASRSST